MTKDDSENKPKKLTLDKNRVLSLNRHMDHSTVKRSVINSKSGTVVEVKKSLKPGSGLRLETGGGGDITEEMQYRLSLVKRAADSQKHDSKISSLSELAAINRPTASVEHQELTLDEPLKVAENEDEQPQQSNVTENEKVVRSEEVEIENKKESTDIKPKPKPSVAIEEEISVERKKNNEPKQVTNKPKVEESRKFRKSDILSMLEGDGVNRTRSLAAIRRAREKEKRKHEQDKQDKIYREVTFAETITVSDLANKMSERVADVIRELMKLGIIATASHTIDADTAEIVIVALGHTPKRIQESDVENVLIQEDDRPEDLIYRAPVVAVMGHVDHGKTSLLDALRSTDVASGEIGGITQHIGAYRVVLPNKSSITFIDTPGHAAFTEMRMRGAQVTDIAVIVVAADEGIKPQTIEAINHVKAAKIPIVVAINKMDKPNASPEKVKQELLSHDLIPEEFGGDVITVPISALKRTGLDKLEEVILLIAEMQGLKANPKAPALGTVIESRVDQGKGCVATVLVQRGTLKIGDIVIAGSTYGKVRSLVNDRGLSVSEVTPSEPVELYGLEEAPKSGEKFNVVRIEKQARDIADYRKRLSKYNKVSVVRSTSLDDLFKKASGTQKLKYLGIIIKADVHGSLEAIVNSLAKLPTDEVQIKIIHQAVGAISESDVALAGATNSLIFGFNVRASTNTQISADRNKIDIRYFSIIYDLIDEVKAMMSGMLDPILREEFIGSVEIRQVFNITKVGNIAGSYVTKGVIKRGAGVRLLRDNIVIHEGKLKTLKRFKEEVKEVREAYECGIAFENYEDIKVGDIVEVFEIIQERRSIA
jgi:translation initiation factor IF-2